MKKSIITIMVIVIAMIHVQVFAAKFKDNGNKTVTDAATSLMWQQTEGGLQKWQAAISYCDNLSLGGHDDWRLPNIKELLTLVDNNFAQPTMDTTHFPDFPPTRLFYWSSSEVEGNKYKAKGVIFNYGTENDFVRNKKIHVRCVRDAQ